MLVAFLLGWALFVIVYAVRGDLGAVGALVSLVGAVGLWALTRPLH